MPRIEWSKGSRHKVKAEDAYGELERIRGDGVLAPQSIVDASAPADAVLHPEFEWDDTVAANEFRKEQARGIVRTLRVVEGEGEAMRESPALVSVIVNDERGYQPTSVVFVDADAVEFVLREAMDALRGWQKRYARLREQKQLTRVWEAIDEVVNG